MNPSSRQIRAATSSSATSRSCYLTRLGLGRQLGHRGGRATPPARWTIRRAPQALLQFSRRVCAAQPAVVPRSLRSCSRAYSSGSVRRTPPAAPCHLGGGAGVTPVQSGSQGSLPATWANRAAVRTPDRRCSSSALRSARRSRNHCSTTANRSVPNRRLAVSPARWCRRGGISRTPLEEGDLEERWAFMLTTAPRSVRPRRCG